MNWDKLMNWASLVKWPVWRILAALLAGALIAVTVGRIALAGGAPPTGETATAVPKGAPKVVVTIKPIHSLVTRLLEGIATPRLLVTGAGSPHTFALKPSDVRALNDADVFVRVSDALEPFTRAIVRSLPQSVEVVTLSKAPGVKLLDQRSGATFDSHEHGDNDHEHEGAIADGHIWLDPGNAKAVVAELAGALSRSSPGHSARIKENAARLATDIDAMTADIAAETAALKDKPFVVFHDAYQYFERRFGLDAAGAITVSPDHQPSAKRLVELRRRIASLNAVCVFVEPRFQPGLVAAITEGSNAHVGTLDPEGSGLEPGPDLYITLMRNLATGFKTCLAPPS
jgi:zinc transport system substrate-binding protein